MEVLRSRITHNSNIDKETKIEGVYGQNGFFFQQRRGHLDLRGISSLDLDKLVREVDVDTLQLFIENITFCNLREEDLRYLTDPQVIKLFKISQLMIEYLLYSQDLFISNISSLSKKYMAKKKSLAKKRRELEELEESTKHLRNQVKAKKQNIATLEELLRENKSRHPVVPARHSEDPPAVIQSKQSKLKFFVAGPDGLCVEFTEKPENSIAVLRKEVKQAFVPKRDTDSSDNLKSVKLVYKGKLLLDERTIQHYDIQPGDTVVALIDVEQQTVEVPRVSVALAPAVPAPSKESGLTEMMEFLGRQQEAMREFAHDIKDGWESALKNVTAGRKEDQLQNQAELRLLEKFDDKWERLETTMKSQLDEKLLHYQALLAAQQQPSPALVVTRRRVNLGELESDPDDQSSLPVLNDINSKLSRFGSQLSQLESKSVVTDKSINDLREALNDRPTDVVHIHNNTTVAAAEFKQPAAAVENKSPVKDLKMAKTGGDTIHNKFNKWNELPDSLPGRRDGEAKEESVQAKVIGELAIEPIVVEKPVPVTEKQAPPPEPVARAPLTLAKPDAPKATTSLFTEVVFPFALNPDVVKFAQKREDGFSVQLRTALDADDVVFELRKALANQMKVQLGRVSLSLDGKAVVLDVDANEEVLTVSTAKMLASIGRLKVKVSEGKPLTDAQIDLLVPSWQRSQTHSESEGDKSQTSKKRLNRRDWDEKGLDAAREDDAMYFAVRGSMDEALSGVSDCERLTDDEMQKKMQTLKTFTASLPSGVADHLRNFRSKAVGVLAAATIDSGAEEVNDTDLRVSGAQDRARLARSVSQSFSLTKGRSGFYGLDDVDVGSSGVLRRSVTDYEQEANAIEQIYNNSPVTQSTLLTNSDVPRLKQQDGHSFKTMTADRLAGTRPTDTRLQSGTTVSSGSRANRYSGDSDEVDSELDEEEEDRRTTVNARREERRLDRTAISSIATGERDDLSEDESFSYLENTHRRSGDSDLQLSSSNVHVVEGDAERRFERQPARASSSDDRGRVTPPTVDYDRNSPDSRARQQQRTFSNASKASSVSLFRNLPAGGGSEDGSVNSLALSDSNNFEDYD